MGVNNKFPDFTLWRRSNSNLYVWINRNNKSSNYALWHGKPLGSQYTTCAMGQLGFLCRLLPTYLPGSTSFFEQAYKCMTVWNKFPFCFVSLTLTIDKFLTRKMIHAVRLGFGLYRLVHDEQHRKASWLRITGIFCITLLLKDKLDSLIYQSKNSILV